MLGKLTWSAIPFDQPIPMAASVFMVLAILGVLAWVMLKGYAPYLWREWVTSVDHKRIGVMYCLLALVMLLRGFSDAIMMRSQQALSLRRARLSAARTLRPDIFRARHDHDLFRGDAVHDRPHEFRGAAATRRARRSVPDLQFGELLADGFGRVAGQYVARHRRIRQNGLARLSPSVGIEILAGRRRRLLSLGSADIRHRHAADRRQFRHDDPQNSRAGHDLYAHADLLLDGARRQSADRRRLSDPHRDFRDAAARSLPRLPFLHDRSSAATR